MKSPHETVIYLSEVEKHSFRNVGNLAVIALFTAEYTYPFDEFPEDVSGPHDHIDAHRLVMETPGYRFSKN